MYADAILARMRRILLPLVYAALAFAVVVVGGAGTFLVVVALRGRFG